MRVENGTKKKKRTWTLGLKNMLLLCNIYSSNTYTGCRVSVMKSQRLKKMNKIKVLLNLYSLCLWKQHRPLTFPHVELK